MAVVRLERISKRFPGAAAPAVDDVSLRIEDGEFMVVLGPSGCGKSTTLRMIAGLETISGGELWIDEALMNRVPAKDRDIAMVFQSYALYPHMSVYENLAFSLRLRRLPRDEIDRKVEEAARLLEIDELLQRRPQALSGGQRQRVALGRAIVRQPRVFLFDEPLSNLDATLRTSMRVELARLHRRLKATILYVTHDQAEALTLGEKIIVLNRGTIQQMGAASEIYHKPANPMVARFVGTPQMNLFEGRLDDNGGRFHSKNLRLDLAGLLQRSLARLAGQPLILGVRPEDFHMADPAQAWISGEVDLIEDLGSDRFLHVQCDGIEVIARDGREQNVQPGDRIGLDVDSDRVHLFCDDRRFEP
ncbi:MAG TPA: sn-glycerol-3-phosphate ABC transporter ATP-binding protein UgpC [Woeseiaceae bacterium]|nr:sn-glycerol-3-phosphate ABC transporter ATP-binding protein UgpC [Woeseiaceae bacterium]